MWAEPRLWWGLCPTVLEEAAWGWAAAQWKQEWGWELWHVPAGDRAAAFCLPQLSATFSTKCSSWAVCKTANPIYLPTTGLCSLTYCWSCIRSRALLWLKAEVGWLIWTRGNKQLEMVLSALLSCCVAVHVENVRVGNFRGFLSSTAIKPCHFLNWTFGKNHIGSTWTLLALWSEGLFFTILCSGRESDFTGLSWARLTGEYSCTKVSILKTKIGS